MDTWADRYFPKSDNPAMVEELGLGDIGSKEPEIKENRAKDIV